MKGTRRGALFLTALVSAQCCLLAGCATPLARPAPPPPPLVQHHAPTIPDEIDVLAITPAMQSFLERYVLPYGDRRTRISLLMLAVTDKGVLGFHYNPSQTLTAAEAFRRRSGNCVAFANLFVTLARAAGLEARFQEVYIEPEWSSRGDTLLVTKHMNVVVDSGRRSYVIDVSGQEIAPDARRRLLRDDEALALFYNNLGADALILGSHSDAYGWFARAVEAAPNMPDAWSNLGVLLGRNEQIDDAEQAYLQALAADAREMAAMGNLHDLYIEQGREAEAAQMERRVERYRRENPYYLQYLSEEALLAGDIEEADRLINLAIGLKENEHLLQYTKARVEYLAGDISAAEISLQKARQLAPPGLFPEYQRPLAELLWQERQPSLE